MASKTPLRIVITTGDPDGIGWEVTAKALNSLGPQPNVHFTVMASKKRVGPRLSPGRHAIELIERTDSPAQWVEDAAQACLKGKYRALVTGPLSKTSIIQAGKKDIGHTEILARVSRTRDLFMGFIGNRFSVVLASGHEPLSQAVRNLDKKKLKLALGAAMQLRSTLPPSKRRKPIALVGLNPHAGENGLLGREERWFKTLTGPDVHGPLVPDAAFLPANWKRYSVYVTPYHDQGLIPFKMVHGFESGVHLTLNLPFVRTSVDHGTAKELCGRNKAQPGSMRDAIITAIRLAREKNS